MKVRSTLWLVKLSLTKFFKFKTSSRSHPKSKTTKESLKQKELKEKEEKIHLKENGQLSTN